MDEKCFENKISCCIVERKIRYYNQNLLMKHTITLFLILNTCCYVAQNSEIQLDNYGRSHSFSMGHFPEKLYLPSINIQMDSNFYHKYKNLSNFRIIDPSLSFRKDYYREYFHLDLDFDTLGNLQPGKGRDPQYKKMDASARCWDRKFVFNRLLAIGQIHLPESHAKKIKWLDMDLHSGRITDFSNYKKLQVVHFYNQHLYRSYGNHRTEQYFFSESNLNYYPGDPFIWKSLLQAPLQALSVDQYANPYSRGIPGNIYFLDEDISELIGTGKLKSLNIKDIPYFPVNFKDFKSIEHLNIGTLLAPEQVNLALVMRSFNKYRPGNWSMYFASFDTTAIVTIPVNGIYISYYKNGQVLCRGNYIENKPDGMWEFWYDNGQLCEERHYKNGQKEGNWTFYNPEGDTIIQFQYLNNQLIYRKEVHFRDIHPCISQELDLNVQTTIEHTLNWKGENEVHIEKKLYSIVLPTWQQRYKIGDTLSGFHETWNFSVGEWEYWSSDFCMDQQDFDTLHLKGKLGETPYFSEGKSIYKERNSKYTEHLSHSERHWTIDYQNCYWEYQQYSNYNKEKIYRLEKTDKRTIPLTEGFCK